MKSQGTEARAIERAAWYALLACVGLVPLAVGKLPFSPALITFDVFGFPQNALLALAAGIALALWSAAVIAGQAKIRLSWPVAAAATLLVWAAVATFTGFEPLRSAFGASTSPLSLAQLGAYAAVFFVAVQLVTGRERLETLTWTVIGSATLVALIALPQQMFKADVLGLGSAVQPWMVERGFSTIGNPDQLGNFLIVPTALAVFALLFDHERARRLIGGGCFAVLLTVLVGTLTRGAWIAVLVGVGIALVALWLTRTGAAARRATLVTALVVAVAIVLAMLGAQKYQLLGLRFGSTPSTVVSGTAGEAVNALTSDRISLWRASLAIASQRPLTGTGPGAYDLGWYRNAIKPSSAGGAGGIADDPHSLPIYILATIGAPGLLAFLALVVGVLVAGVRTAIPLVRDRKLAGASYRYVAWLAAAAVLQLALLIAALDTSTMMLSFLALAVVAAPSARITRPSRHRSSAEVAAVAIALAIAIAVVGATLPQTRAEFTLGSAVGSGDLVAARRAANEAPWNMDIQQAYFSQAVAPVHDALAAGASDASATVDAFVADLVEAGASHPRELYYAALRTQVLSEAAQRLDSRSYADAAVRAAGDALRIMPAHIPTRVNEALALSVLKQYPQMAKALEGYWENELASSYPGVLYAQALALSGRSDQARMVFDQLARRFPLDTSVARYREQVLSGTP